MKKPARSLGVWTILSAGSALLLGAHAGCDGGSVAEAACSSCQEAYTAEDCKKWGDLAGCDLSSTKSIDTCMPGLAGCAFEGCAGAPICDDSGKAQCVSPNGLTQADCDALGKEASCTSATTDDFITEGKMVTGCQFEGCKLMPECP